MNEDKSVLIMVILILSILIIGFSGIIVKHKDVLVKEDTEYLYYKEYEWFNLDSVVYKYHKPIEYDGVVINKRKGSHFVGVVGKGGHGVTDYYITFQFNSKNIEEHSSQLYNRFGLHENVKVIETFYPYYNIEYLKK